MSDNSSGVVIFFVLAGFLLYLYGQLSKHADEEARKKANALYDENKKKLLSELYDKRHRMFLQLEQKEKDLIKREKELQNKIELQNKLFEEKTIGFPWIADQYALYHEKELNAIEDYLRTKRNPSPKSADIVKELTRRTKKAERECLIYQGIVDYYEHLFPWLVEFRNADDDIIRQNTQHDVVSEKSDPVEKYLSLGEIKNLDKTEKFQIALDRYWKRHKLNWEIGRDYERYIGYLYESDGYDVTFFGAIKGFEDMGRDLIVKKNGKTSIIQCKCWASEKIIHEKHIFQLFGTCVLYGVDHNEKVNGIFITSCGLSDVAKKCAKALNVKIVENKKFESFPSIKCNISKSGEKIYHLPFDQQYDKIKMEKDKGKIYCTTVKEAEQAGFRRAFRWKGTS